MQTKSGVGRRTIRYVVLVGIAVVLGAASAAGAAVETVPKRVLVNQPGTPDVTLENISFNSVLAKLLPAGDKRVSLSKIGKLGPLDLGASTLVINRTEATLAIESAVVQLKVNGAAKPVRMALKLDWQNEATDLTPIVELSIDAKEIDLVYDDLKDLGGKLVDGFAPSPANDIAPTIGIADTAIAFRWDPDDGNEYVDITGAVNFLGVNWGLLLSVDWKPGDAEPQVVYGFRASDADQGLADQLTLGAILDGEWGSFGSDLRLPDVAMAVVQPEGTTLNTATLRPLPKAFLTDCANDCGGLNKDFDVTPDMSLSATAALDSLGDDIRDIYGYAAGATVKLTGKVGVRIKDLTQEQPVDLHNIELTAALPALSSPQNKPAWLEFGAWSLGFKYVALPESPDLASVQMTASTSAALHLEDLDPGGTGVTVDFDKLTATFSQVGQKTQVNVAAVSGTEWDTPFGVDWMELTGVGFDGQFKRDGTTGTWELSGGVTGNFQLCAARNSGGTCTEPTNGIVRVEAAVGSADIKARFRISLGDDETTIPVFGLLDVMSKEFGVDFDLGDKIGKDLELGQLSIAGELDDEERFTFEASAVSPPLELLPGVEVPYHAYFQFARRDIAGSPTVTVMGGVTPTTGVPLAQLIADGQNPPPAPLENIQLPALGIVVSSHAMDLPSSATLSKDAYDFLKRVHGCPDGVQTAPVPAVLNGPKVCNFPVKLVGGVNLLANIQLPEELADISKQLWIDTTKGMQIRGTVALPGWAPADFENIGLGLELVLPEVNPFDAVEFIERGELSIGVRLEGTPDPSIKMFLEGKLETRWRRNDETVTYNPALPEQPADTCELGTPMTQYLHQPYDADENPAYCYDRLTGRVKTELALSPTKVSLSLLIALESTDGVWEQPFGTPFGLRAARVKFGVEASAPLFNPTFTLGFLGSVQVDTAAILGDPDGPPPTELMVAGAMGLQIIKPAPTPAGVAATPIFKGVRAYFSRLGLYEVIALQKMVYPDVDIASELSIPPLELRDGEIMIGLEADVDLCIDQRIGLAAELWLTTEIAGGGSSTEQDGPCRAFGIDVKPENCAIKQEEGCFASAIVDLSLTGIRIAGAVGAMDFGPIRFDDALLDLRLTPAEQLFVVRGGVEVDGMGSGKLAMKLSGLPAPEADLYGYFDAFGLFEAQVTAKAGLGASLVPPKLDPNVEFHAALRSEFQNVVKSQLQTALRDVQGDVEDIADLYLKLYTDPAGAIGDIRDQLEAAGADIPPELDALVTFIDDNVQPLFPTGVQLPTLSDVLDGGTITGSFDATISCDFGFFYDSSSERCVSFLDPDDTRASFFTCPLLTTLDGDRCTFEVVLPDPADFGVPPNILAILDDVHEEAVRQIEALEGIVPAGVTLDDLFDLLAEGLDEASLIEVSCAEFGFQAGTTPTVDAKLLLELLGTEYGFDWSLNFNDIPGSVTAVLGDLLAAYLSGEAPDVDCTGEVEPPAGLTDDDFNQLTLSVSEDEIDENDTLTLVGTFDGVPDTASEIVIDWGDGTTSTLTTDNRVFVRNHRYLDDRPSGTESDVLPITARVNGSTLTVTPTSVTVNNLAPTFQVLAYPDVDEGESGNLVVEVFDVGTVDRHTVEIDWGDGTSEILVAPARRAANAFRSILAASHTYRDDKPTGTFPIELRVVDDDTGAQDGSATATVSNVAPAITPATLEALDAMSFVEGAQGQVTVDWTDPGLDDEHTIAIDWGDGDQQVLTPPRGSRTVSASHTYADDDPTATPSDVYTVALVVTDDGGAQDQEEADVTVSNVAPSGLTAVLDHTTISEHGTVTVTGTFIDPGAADDHVVVIDWGHAALTDTTIEVDAGDRAYTATKRYGDNGLFPVTVTVTDDDTGVAARTARLRVRSVNPTATINEAGTIQPPSNIRTFLLRAGVPLGLSSSTEDPGSDDLTATWLWGDATSTVHPHLLGSTADLFPSPHVSPRTGSDGVTDSATHTWQDGCLYEVSATWTDDDGGLGTDAVAVVVTGTDTRVRNPGWWTTELQPGLRNKESLADRTLTCYLQIAGHLSSVLPEKRAIGTFAQAIAVLTVSKTSQADELLDRQLLTSWFNIAYGAIRWDQMVDTNGDRITDTLFSTVLTRAEAVRNDPNARRQQLIDQKNILDRINGV